MATSPAQPDPTTDTDASLLERAAAAEAQPATLKQTPEGSEHPSGHTAAADLEQIEAREGRAARRQPQTKR